MMLSKALDYLQAVSVTAAVLFLLWSVAEFVSRMGALVEAYKERTRMIGAQFAESRRVQDRIEQAQRDERARLDRLPSALEMARDHQIKAQQRADALRIQEAAAKASHEQFAPRVTLPPVSR